MKTRSVSLDHAYAITRGWVGPRSAAATGLTTVTDTQTDASGVDALQFDGASVTDLGDGRVLVSIFGNVISPTALAANTDDWSPVDAGDATLGVDTASVIRLDAGAAYNLTGITAPGEGDTHWLELANISAFTVTLKHDVTSLAANRFYCPADTDVALTKDSAVLLWYDDTSTRWRVVGGSEGGSGATGPDGLPGLDGMPGVPGTPGSSGRDGLDGLDGNRGPIGMLAEQDHGTVGAAESINFDGDKDLHRLVLGANCTLSPTGLPASPVPSLVWIILKQPAAGGPFTVTWWAGINWKAGTAPTLSTAANAFDVIGMLYDSINAAYTGFVVGTVTGPQGSQGEPGMDGLPGPQGRQGDPGIDGLDGMGSRGPAGVDGVMGLDGLDGAANAGGSSLIVKDVTGAVSGVVTEIDVPVGTLSISGRVATLRQVPVGMIGAKAHNSGAQAITTSTETTVTFDTEDFDTDGFHDLVTNTGRMTIPAGMGGKYLIVAGCLWAASAGGHYRFTYIKKNGTTYIGSAGDSATLSADAGVGQYPTCIVDLVPGDYIELRVAQNSGGNLNVTNNNIDTFLSLVKLDAGRVGTGVGAKVYNSAAQSVPSGTATVITFDSEEFDTDNFHSVAANTGRITIPPGMGGKYLLMGGGFAGASAAGNDTLKLRKNGTTDVIGGGHVQVPSASNNMAPQVVGLVDAAAGDYFEMLYAQNSGGNVNFGASGSSVSTAWFSIMRLDQGAFGNLASGKATVTSGDITTTGTTFADIAGATVTLVTGARRCLVTASANMKNSVSNNSVLTLLVDGVNVGGAYGMAFMNPGSAGTNDSAPVGFSFITDVLAAGSHTFKLQWRVDGGTGTLFMSTGVSPVVLGVQELPDSGAAGGAGPGTSLLLDYALASDITNQAVTAATAFDMTTNQNFVVASAASVIEVVVRGFCFGNDTSTNQWAARINVDSAGTPIIKYISAVNNYNNGTATLRPNPLAGGSIFLTGLAVGTHTIKVQFLSSGNDHLYCRAATNGPYEALTIQVIEHRN